MVLDILSELFPLKSPRPNKFTIAIGKQVRLARDDTNISQAELARELFCRRSTISDIENGKAEIDALTLAYLAHKFNKPLSYFFPKNLFPLFEIGELSNDEEELLFHFRQLKIEDQKKTLAQIRAIVDL